MRSCMMCLICLAVPDSSGHQPDLGPSFGGAPGAGAGGAGSGGAGVSGAGSSGGAGGALGGFEMIKRLVKKPFVGLLRLNSLVSGLGWAERAHSS